MQGSALPTAVPLIPGSRSVSGYPTYRAPGCELALGSDYFCCRCEDQFLLAIRNQLAYTDLHPRRKSRSGHSVKEGRWPQP
jgi:hypothetical protein